MFNRKQHFVDIENDSIFLWGVRQTGKSTLLKSAFPNSLYFDLLLSDVYRRYLQNPQQLREAVLLSNTTAPIIIDEIQKLPILLDEVHWMIENKGYQFILSGSSPRKLLKEGANLLGGRALKYQLFPLSYSEIPNFDLLKALNRGLLPKHYQSERYEKLLDAYIGNYLQDEIIAETKLRNINVFANFLTKAAFSNAEMVNYSNIATDCGISSNTVKEYFTILEQTMLGNFVYPYQKKVKRRVVSTPRFYFFDVGVANRLLKRNKIEAGSINFGQAFEHYIYHELRTYSEYSGKHFEIRFWRTASGIEVDYILGDAEVAIEVKGTENVQTKHIKGLLAFSDEYTVAKKIIVSMDTVPRLLANDIQALPWNLFLDKLWAGDIL